MSWTYTGNPSNSSKDAVRFLVGDTNVNEQLSTDEEIAWAITQNSNIYAAAVIIANGISTYFATLADSEEIGPIKVSFINRLKFYSQRSKDLNAKSATQSELQVYCGGIYVAEKESNKENTSLVQPNFKIGINDFPSTITSEDIAQ